MLRSVAAALVLVAGAALAQESKPTASVLDPKVSGVATEEAEIIGEAIRDAVVATGKYRVQDRAAMREILAQQQLNASEACDESCIVEQGRMLQVRFLISSTARRVEGMTVISVRMTDVESGEVRGTARNSCESCKAGDQMRMAEALAHEVVTGEKRSFSAATTPASAATSMRPSSPTPSQTAPPPSRDVPMYEPQVAGGVRGSASAGYLMPAGMVFIEGGLGHVSVRAGAGGGVDTAGYTFSALGVAGRYSRDTDGGGWYLEGGAAFLGYDALESGFDSATIFYGMGGWRWQANSGLYFQLGGGAIITEDTDLPVLPAFDIELGWSLWFET